jgi:asparagine synthase (glutamine-hydrolysing)
MCSILGVIGEGLPAGIRINDLAIMGETLAHRGPDQTGMACGQGFAFQHNRLSIIDPENGLQPMKAVHEGFTYTLIYNGELYNTDELRQELKQLGADFKTHCDTEVVLFAYIFWGEACAEKLNGIFAFAIHDERKKQVFLSRDRFGVKPLFYTRRGGRLYFASEIKALLMHPDIPARISQEGLWQLLYLNPVREAGHTVFEGIYDLPPACNMICNGKNMRIRPYWQLAAYENTESEEDIVAHTRFLLSDAIQRQLVSDVPLCTLLSGGLDSSVITAVAARHYKENGMQLSTFSFEYEGNKENFTNTLFQPQSDDEYAVYLADHLGTKHTVLTAETKTIAALLPEAARYRDFPGMADVDSSLMYYCGRIAKSHKVAISGECSDEVFGGYPWFYRPEMLHRDFFPWIHQPHLRAGLFRPEIAKTAEGYAYARQVYQRSLEGCPLLDGESEPMRQSREASWLSINYFMASLLERKDRMSMANSLEVRVPFADHRLVEYVYNVPWEIKYKNNTEKYLLRRAMEGVLPDKILQRKKSPYPKTHNPAYEELVKKMLKTVLMQTDSRLRPLLKKDALKTIEGLDNTTWFGQLMGRPQLMAWLVQMDTWMKYFDIEFV